MNFFVVFGVLATIFASMLWNIDCAPQSRSFSSRTITTSSNGGPSKTYEYTNNNGQEEYKIDGQRVSESEFGNPFGSNMDMDMSGIDGMDMGSNMVGWPNFNHQQFPTPSFDIRD